MQICYIGIDLQATNQASMSTTTGLYTCTWQQCITSILTKSKWKIPNGEGRVLVWYNGGQQNWSLPFILFLFFIFLLVLSKQAQIFVGCVHHHLCGKRRMMSVCVCRLVRWSQPGLQSWTEKEIQKRFQCQVHNISLLDRQN